MFFINEWVHQSFLCIRLLCERCLKGDHQRCLEEYHPRFVASEAENHVGC
jgi:hypothetical protein